MSRRTASPITEEELALIKAEIVLLPDSKRLAAEVDLVVALLEGRRPKRPTTREPS